VEFLSIKILLNEAVNSPETVDIEQLDEVITWLLARAKTYPWFEEAARQMDMLRRHVPSRELRQAKGAARRALDFLG
jgi:hypothetical protein